MFVCGFPGHENKKSTPYPNLNTREVKEKIVKK